MALPGKCGDFGAIGPSEPDNDDPARDAGILPIAPVLELGEALDSPFLVANKMIARVPHPARPDMRVLANPIKINGKRLSQQTCSPMGADTKEVLARVAGPELA